MISNRRQLKFNSLLVIFVVIALGALSVIAQEGITREGARKELLQETFRLLDKIESEFPQTLADVVKVRERVKAIYESPPEPAPAEEPEAQFLRRTRSKSDLQQFYNSVRTTRNYALKQKLVELIRAQKPIEYSDARRYVMLKVDNYNNRIECIYTGKTYSAEKMPAVQQLNIEHSWPQSKGAKGIAKSDMHHLFPTDPIANSTRGSLPFGIVDDPEWSAGGSECDGDVFEPRSKFRGNIARALFYFSVRYSYAIDPAQERVLRQWHRDDPVDANEKLRNDRVEQIQGNRNPFIDRPELVDQIADF